MTCTWLPDEHGGAQIHTDRPWDELAPETQDAIKAVIAAARRHIDVLGRTGPDLCGAIDGVEGEHVYGRCTKPAGHPEGWHREVRDGKVWAEWRGPFNGPGREPEEI